MSGAPPPRERVTLRLPPEAAERLRETALALGLSPSDVVARLLLDLASPSLLPAPTAPRMPEILSDEQLAEMRAAYDAGDTTQTELAELYGVAQTTVSRHLAGRPWAGFDPLLRQRILAFVTTKPRTASRVGNQFSMPRRRAEMYLESLGEAVQVDNYGRLWSARTQPAR